MIVNGGQHATCWSLYSYYKLPMCPYFIDSIINTFTFFTFPIRSGMPSLNVHHRHTSFISHGLISLQVKGLTSSLNMYRIWVMYYPPSQPSFIHICFREKRGETILQHIQGMLSWVVEVDEAFPYTLVEWNLSALFFGNTQNILWEFIFVLVSFPLFH